MPHTIPIQNPDFEDGFNQHDGIGELTVPNGWLPWWRQGNPAEVAQGYLKRPEYALEEQRVHAGRYAAKLFTTFATHDAGLYQQIPVPIGALLALTAEVQYWSEHTDGTGGGYGMQVGIDAGPTTMPSRDCVWGPWRGQDDLNWDGNTWRTVYVTYLCDTPLVTLYLRGLCRFRAKHNDSYWDHVVLEAEVANTPPDDLLEYLRLVEEQSRQIGARIQEIHDLFHKPIAPSFLPPNGGD